MGLRRSPCPAHISAGFHGAGNPRQVMSSQPVNEMLWDKKLVTRYRVRAP